MKYDLTRFPFDFLHFLIIMRIKYFLSIERFCLLNVVEQVNAKGFIQEKTRAPDQTTVDSPGGSDHHKEK